MSKETSTLEKIKDFIVNLGKEEVNEPVITAEDIATAEVVDLTLEPEVKTEEVAVELAEEPIVEEEVVEEPKAEFVSMEEFNSLKALVSELQRKVEGETEEMQKENVELKAELDAKPDAAKVVHAPKDVKIDLSTKENRFLNIIKKNK